MDLASHDGRWCYAFAQAGAREVVGVEGRQELAAQFADFPDEDLKKRVELKVGDIFDELRNLALRKQPFDVVAVLGVYYHIMDHFHLLKLIYQLRPSLIIVDSLFLTEDAPIIRLETENTDHHLAAIPQVKNQKKAVIGVVSRRALELMAASLDFEVHWLDWDTVPKDRRTALEDYYQPGGSRRFTCALRSAANLG